MAEKHVTRKSHASLLRDKPRHSEKMVGDNVNKVPKGGAGGKGTWGKPGDELKGAVAVLDKNDPNFDDETENEEFFSNVWSKPEEKVQLKFASSVADLNKFKKAVRNATDEVFVSTDQREFVKRIKELDMPLFHQDIPSIVIKRGLDKSESDRKRVLELLQALHEASLISKQQMLAGIRKLFNQLDDLVIDLPNARSMVSEFLESAVKLSLVDAKEADALQASAKYLADRAAVQKDKDKIKFIVAEYFQTQDTDNALKSLAELKAPHLGFELVKRLISTALDRTNRERELASSLLSAAVGANLSSDEVVKGFTILLERVEDTYLDVRDVLRLMSCFVARAVADEVLPPAFLVRVDLAEGDMGFQVVSHAQSLLKQPQAALKLELIWADPTSAPLVRQLSDSEAALIGLSKAPGTGGGKRDAWDDEPQKKPVPAAGGDGAKKAAGGDAKKQKKASKSQQNGEKPKAEKPQSQPQKAKDDKPKQDANPKAAKTQADKAQPAANSKPAEAKAGDLTYSQKRRQRKKRSAQAKAEQQQPQGDKAPDAVKRPADGKQSADSAAKKPEAPNSQGGSKKASKN